MTNFHWFAVRVFLDLVNDVTSSTYEEEETEKGDDEKAPAYDVVIKFHMAFLIAFLMMTAAEKSPAITAKGAAKVKKSCNSCM